MSNTSQSTFAFCYKDRDNRTYGQLLCDKVKELMTIDFVGITAEPMHVYSRIGPACDDNHFVRTSDKYSLCCNTDGIFQPCANGDHLKVNTGIKI